MTRNNDIFLSLFVILHTCYKTSHSTRAFYIIVSRMRVWRGSERKKREERKSVPDFRRLSQTYRLRWRLIVNVTTNYRRIIKSSVRNYTHYSNNMRKEKR